MAVLSLAVLTACGGRDASSPRAPRLGELTAVPRATSPADVELSNGSSIDVDARGNIYVADASDVAVFSPDASLLRRVGREGDGPGEFGSVQEVRILPGDSLFVFDAKKSRLTVFAPASDRPAQTVSLATAGLIFPHWLLPLGSEPGFVAVYNAAFGMAPAEGARGGRREVVRLLNPDASVRQDSVLSLPEYEALQVRLGETGMAALFDPFGRRSLVASDGRRLYTAWTGDWRVDVHSLSGKLLRTVRPNVPAVPRPITPAERDSVVRALSSPMIAEPVVRRAMEAADHRDWPLLQALLVDDAGRIWLAETGLRGEPLHWLAIDERGELLARFDVPVNVAIRLIRGSTAYGIARDENDVPHVVVYDLKPTSTTPAKRS
jgi:hypothetical protein